MKFAYFDAAYIAKCYLREPDADAVRDLAKQSDGVYTSSLAIAEVACVFHRHRREGTLTDTMSLQIRELFWQDVASQVWMLVPMTDRLVQKVEIYMRTLASHVFVRAGDAVHLVSAIQAGLSEIWTNDRHMLAAAEHFGLKGRSVPAK